MHKIIRYFSIMLAVFFIISGCGTKVDRLEVSKLFSDGMVLQREAPVRVWGLGTPGAIVKVTLNDLSDDVVVGEDGKWKAELEAQSAGGPYEMTVISGPKSITIGDVLIGEVWLASGQSNMQMRVEQCKDAEQEIASSDNSRIRQFHVYRFPYDEPLDTLVGPFDEGQEYANKWEEASPTTTGHFSAVAYFFARELENKLGVPVGIVHASWGGTEIECWMSDDAFKSNKSLEDPYLNWKDRLFERDSRRAGYEKYEAELEELKKDAAENGRPVSAYVHKPTVLYKGMLKPVIPYSIRGALWYQGEANARYPEDYDDLMEAMIAGWRSDWNLGDLPFLYVQLAGWEPGGENWPELRNAQTKVLEYPNTGMALALDIGEEKDIHPKNKQEVGYRLSLDALKLAYGKDVLSSGPMFDSLSHDGNKIIVTFKYAGDGIAVSEGSAPGCFEVYDRAKEEWVKADATISAENQVTVWSKSVKKPAAVRYGWKSWTPDANLYNTQGDDIWLPAVPFLED